MQGMVKDTLPYKAFLDALTRKSLADVDTFKKTLKPDELMIYQKYFNAAYKRREEIMGW